MQLVTQFINLINEIGAAFKLIMTTIINNLGASIFIVGMLGLIAMIIYALWNIKRHQATVGDIINDHMGKIILIILLMVAGAIISGWKI